MTNSSDDLDGATRPRRPVGKKRAAPAASRALEPRPRHRGAVEQDPAAQMALLGGNVKMLRKRANMSLEELALASGVSRAMLSKVERSEKSPTLTVLARIAHGLDLTVSTLLGAEPDRSLFTVVRRDERLVYRDPHSNFERHLLSPTHLGTGVEFLLHIMPPQTSSGELPAYTLKTEKYIVVHEGQLTVEFDNQTAILNTGDAMYFEVVKNYIFSNTGDVPCQYYICFIRSR